MISQANRASWACHRHHSYPVETSRPREKIMPMGPKRPGGRIFKEPTQYTSAFARRQFRPDQFGLAVPFWGQRRIVDSLRSAGRVRYGLDVVSAASARRVRARGANLFSQRECCELISPHLCEMEYIRVVVRSSESHAKTETVRTLASIARRGRSLAFPTGRAAAPR